MWTVSMLVCVSVCFGFVYRARKFNIGCDNIMIRNNGKILSDIWVRMQRLKSNIHRNVNKNKRKMKQWLQILMISPRKICAMPINNQNGRTALLTAESIWFSINESMGLAFVRCERIEISQRDDVLATAREREEYSDGPQTEYIEMESWWY